MRTRWGSNKKLPWFEECKDTKGIAQVTLWMFDKEKWKKDITCILILNEVYAWAKQRISPRWMIDMPVNICVSLGSFDKHRAWLLLTIFYLKVYLFVKPWMSKPLEHLLLFILFILFFLFLLLYSFFSLFYTDNKSSYFFSRLNEIMKIKKKQYLISFDFIELVTWSAIKKAMKERSVGPKKCLKVLLVSISTLTF